MAFVRTAISTTGNTTAGSPNLTNVVNTTGIYAGMLIYGANIPADTLVNSVSGTTVVMNRNAVATQTGVTITGQYITQTGTDADPSGLSAMTGVTTITSGTGSRLKSIFDLGTNQLRIQGTLTHDPDQYTFVSGLQLAVRLESGTYNYGIATTVNGKTSYSKSCGLELTYQGGIASNFPIQMTGGTFNWRGGIIRLGGAFSMTNGTFDQKGDTSVAYNNNTGTQIQLRTILPPANMRYEKIKLAGVNQVFFWTTQTYAAISAALENGGIQTPAGFSATQTYADFVFANNQAPGDFYINQLSGTSSTLSIVKNPDVIPRVTQLNTAAYGVVETRTSLAFNVSDSNGVSAANVVGYVKDSNNGARTNENQLTSYTSDQTYIASSSVAGAISLGDILVDVQMRNPAATNTVKHDYRSNYGNGSADFNVFLGGYEYLATATRQTLIGNGGRSVAWTMFDDTNVTASRANALTKLASSFTVNATTKVVTVTANSNYDDLYDALKAWKYNGTQTNVEAPVIDSLVVSANGSNLTAYTGWSLVVNSGVTFSSGAKFTFVYFDTVTNNGTITGIYSSLAGTSTIWRFEDVAVGSSIVIYDDSGVTKYFQGNITTAGDYNYYIPPGTTGTYSWAIELYGKQRQSGSFAANTGGLLFYAPIYIEDVGITETTQATVEAYTTIETPERFYDRTAVFRLTEQGIKVGQIVTRSGTAIEIQSGLSHVINKDAASVYALSGGVITTKSVSYAAGTKYTTEILVPPATLTANTTEVITIAIEDANGNSQVTINGGDGEFELWKVTTATATADYATGTLLDTVGNGIYRFVGVTGFDIVGVDVNSNIRRRSSMAKGIYTQAFYVGDQIQLAQAPQVIENGIKLDVLTVNIEDIKGTGFTKDKHSLTKIWRIAKFAASVASWFKR